jgi:hypothetical protein
VSHEVDGTPEVEDLVYMKVDECRGHICKCKVTCHKENAINNHTFLKQIIILILCKTVSGLVRKISIQ